MRGVDASGASNWDDGATGGGEARVWNADGGGMGETRAHTGKPPLPTAMHPVRRVRLGPNACVVCFGGSV